MLGFGPFFVFFLSKTSFLALFWLFLRKILHEFWPPFFRVFSTKAHRTAWSRSSKNPAWIYTCSSAVWFFISCRVFRRIFFRLQRQNRGKTLSRGQKRWKKRPLFLDPPELLGPVLKTPYEFWPPKSKKAKKHTGKMRVFYTSLADFLHLLPFKKRALDFFAKVACIILPPPKKKTFGTFIFSLIISYTFLTKKVKVPSSGQNTLLEKAERQ